MLRASLYSTLSIVCHCFFTTFIFSYIILLYIFGKIETSNLMFSNMNKHEIMKNIYFDPSDYGSRKTALADSKKLYN